MTRSIRTNDAQGRHSTSGPRSGPGTLIVHATILVDPDWDPLGTAVRVRTILRADPNDRVYLATEHDDDGRPFLRLAYVISNPAVLDVSVLCQSLGIPDGYFAIQSVEIA